MSLGTSQPSSLLVVKQLKNIKNGKLELGKKRKKLAKLELRKRQKNVRKVRVRNTVKSLQFMLANEYTKIIDEFQLIYLFLKPISNRFG